MGARRALTEGGRIEERDDLKKIKKNGVGRKEEVPE